jgi:hypothetical protein
VAKDDQGITTNEPNRVTAGFASRIILVAFEMTGPHYLLFSNARYDLWREGGSVSDGSISYPINARRG